VEREEVKRKRKEDGKVGMWEERREARRGTMEKGRGQREVGIGKRREGKERKGKKPKWKTVSDKRGERSR